MMMKAISTMTKKVRNVAMSLCPAMLSFVKKAIGDSSSERFWLSWRMGVEANNIRGWQTVPAQCCRHIRRYMTGGQYHRDVELVTHQILEYVNQIEVPGDGMDAWILDVDDTCISNLSYYREKRYGCDPFDPAGFRDWIFEGRCPALPAVLPLFRKLLQLGFKVFLVTGRDEKTMSQVTLQNLHDQGFLGYHRLILRSAVFKRESATIYKTTIRKKLVEEGYRIWGNVGDQWSDLQGGHPAIRSFKFPNPMYFIP